MSEFKKELSGEGFNAEAAEYMDEAERVISQLDALDDEKNVLDLRGAVTDARNNEQGSKETLKDLINKIKKEKGL